jgi:hypothetical protein
LGKKQIKIGVRQGDGPAPGYKWNVGILDFAFEEVTEFLTESQYQHIAMQVKELAREDDPTHSRTLSVDAVEDFFEIREKGGVLGKKNVRIFFALDKTIRAIIILGGIKKENNGPTPDGTRILMKRRLRMYSGGDYGTFVP